MGGLYSVILPFCKGCRSRNVTQPWPIAALGWIRPRPYLGGHGCKTTSTSLQSLAPLPSQPNSSATAIHSALSYWTFQHKRFVAGCQVECIQAWYPSLAPMFGLPHWCIQGRCHTESLLAYPAKRWSAWAPESRALMAKRSQSPCRWLRGWSHLWHSAIEMFCHLPIGRAWNPSTTPGWCLAVLSMFQASHVTTVCGAWSANWAPAPCRPDTPVCGSIWSPSHCAGTNNKGQSPNCGGYLFIGSTNWPPHCSQHQIGKNSTFHTFGSKGRLASVVLIFYLRYAINTYNSMIFTHQRAGTLRRCWG